jgi:hypothetical protein
VVAKWNWTNVLLIATIGVTRYPDDADRLCNQGYSYGKMRQYEKSLDIVSTGIRLDPKPVRYANWGCGGTIPQPSQRVKPAYRSMLTTQHECAGT